MFLVGVLGWHQRGAKPRGESVIGSEQAALHLRTRIRSADGDGWEVRSTTSKPSQDPWEKTLRAKRKKQINIYIDRYKSRGAGSDSKVAQHPAGGRNKRAQLAPAAPRPEEPSRSLPTCGPQPSIKAELRRVAGWGWIFPCCFFFFFPLFPPLIVFCGGAGFLLSVSEVCSSAEKD